ncbi:MAG: molybdenum cofactor biosynthesis protein MoaE [Sphingomonadales bacterium]|jgi:molybdopterin synthase catalytic subunit|nr:molybdenum cofactor biosynthesis protein MoaE [Sphingomonadales bacterium]MBK9002935.1 molybdenum cofactor biosynthesis protein MoaE [Sphingomonadales bacterium]MBK9268183.1 molybdenum cofactor biosynthesis protein MoaE [Sphingomonadales bacterium]MBP6434799.1 molybdenum cofactor biosynthesis protein MoaE [Sphingorhabdus sp.]
MIRVSVQREAFDIAAEIGALEASGVGALATFTGIVRGGDGVTAIELEHYPGMTEASLSDICEAAQERWALTGCTIIHRVGRLDVGAPIVLVVTAAPHRAAALEACAFLIDRLKTDAPFWKREYRGDTALWVEQKASDVERGQDWDG